MESQFNDEFAAMRAALEDFQWTTLGNFRLLIDEFEMRGLRDLSRDRDWYERISGQWERLEEVYAVMADRNMSTPDAILERVTTTAVDNLKVILSEIEHQ